MKQKLILLIFLLASAFIYRANAQQQLDKNSLFTGAKATKSSYKAIYQMDNASPEIIKKTIRNINNLLKDPRLKGKVQVELIAFSGGTEAYRKGSEYEDAIKTLAEKGVIVAQCLNTLEERKIEQNELFGFLAYVPSGNGELVIRASEGWTIIKP